MTHQATPRPARGPLLITGTGALALALLTGCTTAGPGTDDTPADATSGAATASTTPEASSAPATGSDAATDGATEDSPDDAGTEGTGGATGGAGPGETTGSTDDGTGDATDDATASGAPATAEPGASTSAAAGDDPVLAALGALSEERPDAVVVSVDRDDEGAAYEIEAVEGSTVLDLAVGTDGTVRETDDRGDDEEDVRAAREVTVTAEQAAEAALRGRDGQSVDEMELDEEDGALSWKVELDDGQGGAGDEVLVDAATGEVRPGG
ncbi:hypothetical protein E7744_10640 [Citricoccus sp. SGAir0253]|uniref:PepSY domain-containing protein n=1 Tax=Citricoccus sp. SGAir0253 TaxID=2567881 RepID=UPI0010CD31F8|nr:PepSY domain-containing protein [Citricoccus sp. SGAir0253]QCU78559.1 hypothetical protein E7744_10640 [Citricoccus sp. SGAir0253]